jgi:DNA polymerase III delta subunit
MIHILTGEDTVSSRIKLSTIVDQKTMVVRLDAKKNSLSEILDTLESNSLFTDKKTVVVEYFTKIKPDTVFFEKLKSFMKDESTDIVLWDEADLSQKAVKDLQGALIRSFTFPKVFYQFIDNLSPKNKKASQKLLSDLLRSFAPEQVLFSLIKRIRLLAVAKNGSLKEFSEGARLAPWQAEKIAKQASEWTEKDILDFHVKLAEADELVKTSGLAVPLAAHLDMLVLSDLN